MGFAYETNLGTLLKGIVAGLVGMAFFVLIAKATGAIGVWHDADREIMEVSGKLYRLVPVEKEIKYRSDP